jgi:hypothetical protein
MSAEMIVIILTANTISFVLGWWAHQVWSDTKKESANKIKTTILDETAEDS